MILFVYFKKEQGTSPNLPLASCTPKLKEADTTLIFSSIQCPNSAKLHYLLKKERYCMTIVAAILVCLIMTEAGLECEHTKATLQGRGVNKIFDVL